MSDVISEYIENIDEPWKIEIASRLHQLMRAAIPDAEERIQYKMPHYLKKKKYLAVISPAKNWVGFTIFNAQQLDVAPDLFERSTNSERITIKIKRGMDVDYGLLENLVREAASSLG